MENRLFLAGQLRKTHQKLARHTPAVLAPMRPFETRTMPPPKTPRTRAEKPTLPSKPLLPLFCNAQSLSHFTQFCRTNVALAARHLFAPRQPGRRFGGTPEPNELGAGW
jgi:hypothetical protein